MPYFHGGFPGLKPGDALLPPDATGTDHRLSTDGALYSVVPESPVDPDPDCREPGLSWHCPRAIVLAVVDPVVLFRSRTPERWLRMLAGSIPA
jgi:hypothetical protein